jgi:hypothetical protein
MFRKLRSRLTYANVTASLALFFALGGVAAYADNEFTGANIKDGSLTGADVFDNTISGNDITNNSLTTTDIKDFSLGNGDFLTGSVDSRAATDNSLTGADIATQAVGSDEVANDSLTGADIDESTLNLPQTQTTARFVQASGTVGSIYGPRQVAVASLGPHSYAVVADITLTTQGQPSSTAKVTNADCELRGGSTHDSPFLGGSSDRRQRPAGERITRTISMNGGAFGDESGAGAVSVWCTSDDLAESASGQVMLIQLDGFS